MRHDGARRTRNVHLPVYMCPGIGPPVDNSFSGGSGASQQIGALGRKGCRFGFSSGFLAPTCSPLYVLIAW
jgi:uncharacterized membrane protein